MVYKVWWQCAILLLACEKGRATEQIKMGEREMVLEETQWSRDWEQFNQSYIDRNEAEELTNEELIEYLRWLACNRPGRYAKVMTAFASTQGQVAGVAV